MNNKSQSHFYVTFTAFTSDGVANGSVFVSCPGEMFSHPAVIEGLASKHGFDGQRIVILNWIKFDNEAQSLAAQGKGGPTQGTFLRVVK